MPEKIKILYAADNRIGSYFQLKRFISNIDINLYDIKIAAYEISSGNLNIDYTLDCLLNFINPKDDNISFNGNYNYFYNEIKRFNPDIIISDMEIYTSIIAIELNIRLWQFSPLLVDYAFSDDLKYNIGWKRKYAHTFRSNFRRNDYEFAAIHNAERKFVVSYLCDIKSIIKLNNSFEWARPDFLLSEESDIENDNLIISTENNIFNHKDYPKLLFSCKNITSDGIVVFLSDIFYNQKQCTISPKYYDKEMIIYSCINNYFDMNTITINNKVKFLHEHLRNI